MIPVDGAAAQRPPNWPCHVPYPCLQDSLWGVQGDCTKFVICGRGGRVLFTFTCPDDIPRFDVVSRDCVPARQALCQRPCRRVRTTTQSPTTVEGSGEVTMGLNGKGS